MSALPFVLALALAPPSHYAAKSSDLGMGIKVMFPEKPLVIKDPPPSIAGMWSASDYHALYEVEVEEFKDKHLSSAGQVAHAVSVVTAEFEATTVHQTPILLHGWKGSAVELSRSGRKAWYRIYCFKDRTITLSFSPNSGKLSATAGAFFESLTLPKSLVGPFHSATEPERAPAVSQYPFDLGGGVRVVFPAKPKPDADGNESTKTWSCTTDVGNFALAVDSLAVIPLSVDEILKVAAKNSGDVLKAKVASEQPILLNGWKGLQVVFRNDTVNVWARFYLVSDKMYELLYVSPFGRIADDGKTYLESLTLPKSLLGPFHSATEPEKQNVQMNSGPTDLGSGFTVQFPSPPRQFNDTSHPNITAWIVRTSDGIYDADIVDEPNPPSDDGEISIIQAMTGSLRGSHSSLTSQHDIMLKGWPGLEFQGSGERTKIWGRVYHIQNHVVIIGSGTAGGQDFSPAARKFLDSLKLPEGTPLGPHATPGPTFEEYELTDIGVKAIFPAKPRRREEILSPKAPDYPATFYAAQYGDRAFNVIGGRVPSEISTAATDSGVDHFLASAGGALAQGMNMTVLRHNSGTIKGKRVMVTELRNDDRAARVVATYYGGHYVIVVAIAPKAIFPSEEVEKFFASVQEIK